MGNQAELAPACAVGFDTARLRARIESTYERLAHDPESRFHFNVGLDYAVSQLRYDRAELEALPKSCTARFAGVGNPLRAGWLPRGAVVLDHACGAGMDLLLAARRVGAGGKAIGVDVTPAMREQAQRSAQAAGLASVVEIRAGAFEALPVADESVDVVISNGVVNLAPDKSRIFSEIVRVLRPGGLLLLADVMVERELAPAARANPDLWAACVGGALTESGLHTLAARAGLRGGHVVERFDCFRNTALEIKLGSALKVYGASFRACK
jgi:arsenite methyltransferase